VANCKCEVTVGRDRSDENNGENVEQSESIDLSFICGSKRKTNEVEDVERGYHQKDCVYACINKRHYLALNVRVPDVVNQLDYVCISK
jgi:hypothetical protein